VGKLSGGNVLLNADGGADGAGARLTPDVGDRVLSSRESIEVDFVIGLRTLTRFAFFVNLFGMPGL